ncbi:hypothetical protein ACJJTC_005822, partial [Scirpophaga incertulas]
MSKVFEDSLFRIIGRHIDIQAYHKTIATFGKLWLKYILQNRDRVRAYTWQKQRCHIAANRMRQPLEWLVLLNEFFLLACRLVNSPVDQLGIRLCLSRAYFVCLLDSNGTCFLFFLHLFVSDKE